MLRIYFFALCCIVSASHAFVSVKIHRHSCYHPLLSCAFIRNASLLTDVSIQGCIWECVNEDECQTAVYYKDDQTCSMFKELCSTGSIQPSENISMSVICYQKNHVPITTCSSTAASSQRDEESTSVADVIVSTETTTTTTSTTTTTTATNPCILGNYRWNTTGITVLNSTQITSASDLFFDANDTLYIVDEYNNSVVWKLPKNAATPILFAGNVQSMGSNSSQLNFPQGVYVDSNGSLYVSDYFNYRMQKYINGSGIGETIAGITMSKGAALNQFGGLRYFSFDPTETYVYITDCDNHRIMRYPTNSTTGTNGTIVAGGNGSGNATTQLNYPWGICYLPSISNYMYITNYQGHTVMKWIPGNATGIFIAGTPGVSGSNATSLAGPMGIKLDVHLNMFIVDNGNNRVQLFCYDNQTGTTILGDGTAGSNATQFNNPRGIAFDSSMNIYISDQTNLRIQKFLKL